MVAGLVEHDVAVRVWRDRPGSVLVRHVATQTCVRRWVDGIATDVELLHNCVSCTVREDLRELLGTFAGHTVVLHLDPLLEPDAVRRNLDVDVECVITVLDAESGKVITKIEVGERPRAIVFTTDGSRAYVSGETGGTVTVVDAQANKPLKTIKMPEGAKPMGVAISPDQKRLYVATGRGKTVAVIDVATDSIIGSVEVGVRPWGIALTADGRKLYSANGPSNDVSVVDTESMKVIKKIPAGELPWGVAIGKAP